VTPLLLGRRREAIPEIEWPFDSVEVKWTVAKAKEAKGLWPKLKTQKTNGQSGKDKRTLAIAEKKQECPTLNKL
jgi:hypothetical protein